MNEWELFLQMGPSNNINVHELDLLGRREFDSSYKWEQLVVPQELHEIATQFINMKKTCSHERHTPSKYVVPDYTLSSKKKLALTHIINHSKHHSNKPLYMIIQGTAGTGKSYLIARIRKALDSYNMHQQS